MKLVILGKLLKILLDITTHASKGTQNIVWFITCEATWDTVTKICFIIHIHKRVDLWLQTVQ